MFSACIQTSRREVYCASADEESGYKLGPKSRSNQLHVPVSAEPKLKAPVSSESGT